jgi:curved DNA-binding protein CbpA
VEEIRKRRRELAFLHHPDRGGDVNQLVLANEAADVLLDFYGAT